MAIPIPEWVHRLWYWINEPVLVARAWFYMGLLFAIKAAIHVVSGIVGIWV